MCYVKSLKQIPVFLQTGINYFQAIGMKLMKFTVLYIATMKGGKQLLRKKSKTLCSLIYSALTQSKIKNMLKTYEACLMINVSLGGCEVKYQIFVLFYH